MAKNTKKSTRKNTTHKSTTQKTTSSKASMKDSNRKISVFGVIWRLMLCIAVPLGGGFAISLLSQNAMTQFGEFEQPLLAPPAWLFPVAWTILYILMGIASFFIFYKGAKDTKKSNTALVIYGIQLILNFCWTIVFFNLQQRWLAFAILAVMWILIIVLLSKAKSLSNIAFFCLLPYFLWTTFAAYLNIMIAILN